MSPHAGPARSQIGPVLVRRNPFAIRTVRRLLTSTIACRRMYRKSGGGGNCTRRSELSSRCDHCLCKIDGCPKIENGSRPRETHAEPRRNGHPVTVAASSIVYATLAVAPSPAHLVARWIAHNLRTSVRHTEASSTRFARVGLDRPKGRRINRLRVLGPNAHEQRKVTHRAATAISQ